MSTAPNTALLLAVARLFLAAQGDKWNAWVVHACGACGKYRERCDSVMGLCPECTETLKAILK